MPEHQEKETGKKPLKNKIIAATVAAAVLVAFAIPLSLASAPPARDEAEQGIVLENKKGPRESAAPEPEQDGKKPVPGELRQWTNDNKQTQSIVGNDTAMGASISTTDRLGDPPKPTSSMLPGPSAYPTPEGIEVVSRDVNPEDNITEGRASQSPVSGASAQSESAADTAGTLEESTTSALPTGAGRLEEKTIAPEESASAVGGKLEEHIVEAAPTKQPDSLEVAGAVNGEDFDGDIEALMQKPVETRTGMLQERLMELGYMEKDPAAEVYDAQTQLAVMYFQRSHGLTITGVMDDEIYSLAMSDQAKPYIIEIGTQGEDVRQLQQDLSSMGQGVSVNGIFDQITSDSAGVICAELGMEYGGAVDMDIRHAIASQAAIRGVTYLPPSQSQAGAYNPGGAGVIPTNAGVESFIAAASAQLGKPYILGAKGPDAFDCSGFIYYCLNQIGYQIDYMTSGGWAKSGYTTVSSMSELMRGDVVCFNGHVGIYLGNGRMIDASSSDAQVRVSSELATSGYWTSNFICGKRVLY